MENVISYKLVDSGSCTDPTTSRSPPQWHPSHPLIPGISSHDSPTYTEPIKGDPSLPSSREMDPWQLLREILQRIKQVLYPWHWVLLPEIPLRSLCNWILSVHSIGSVGFSRVSLKGPWEGVCCALLDRWWSSSHACRFEKLLSSLERIVAGKAGEVFVWWAFGAWGQAWCCGSENVLRCLWGEEDNWYLQFSEVKGFTLVVLGLGNVNVRFLDSASCSLQPPRDTNKTSHPVRNANECAITGLKCQLCFITL